MDAQFLENYAGTSKRSSKRVVVSTAVQYQWKICTTDISKALVQGVTYKELAEAIGETLREVNFILPGYCVAILKQLPGYETFDPTKEVLH